MIPQLAVVYSKALMEALAEGDVPVDRIVVYPWHTDAQLREARSYRPLLLHGMPAPFALNQPDPFESSLMAQIERRLAMADSPWFSTYLIVEPPGQATDTQSQPSQSQVYLNVCRNALRLKDRLSIPLLLTNPRSRADSACAYACEPLFITAVLDAVGCDFSLDLAHARMSACHLGIDQERYFRSLPLFRVRELEVSGPYLRDNATISSREPLSEPDWEALSFLLARTKPEIVALNSTPGKDQVQRLKSLLQTTADHPSAFP